jgi:hypothetical protein
MRFYLRPGSLTKSFTDQVESLFIPAFVSLSILCSPCAAVACQRLTYSAIVRLVSSLASAAVQLDLNLLTLPSIAVILTNICQYGVPHCGVWLIKTLQVLFWIYTGLSAIASAGLYLILWSTL